LTNVSHVLLNHVHNLSLPLIQIITGVASAIAWQRFWLSRSAAFARRRSVPSRKTRTTPMIWLPSSKIGAALSSMDHS